MSESVYICAASVCCCLVVCALVRLIAPSGDTTKVLSLVIGIFALCCLLSPIVSLASEFDVKNLQVKTSVDTESFQNIYNEQVLKSTGDYINGYAFVLLKKADINIENVKTVIGADENKGIYIREMNIYVKGNNVDKSNNIKEMIENSLGIEPEILESEYEE